ncbi:MAG: HEAT repeat domain-containing protein [Planctomycetota bacterium]
MKSCFVAAVLLLAASCGGEPPPPPHEETPRLMARLDALLPHLSAELEDFEIGDDSVVVLESKEFSLRAAAECSYAEKVFGPSTEEEQGGGWLFAQLFSIPVITDEGVMLLAGLTSDDGLLTARLIHGLVQVHLCRDHDLGAFRSGPGTLEEALARHAALEAFTRRIGRRIAERAGVTKDYRHFDRGPTPEFGPDEIESGWEQSVLVALAGDRHVRDTAEVFATRSIDLHGLAGAIERLFAHPPTTVGSLRDPDGRPVETPRSEIGRAVQARLADGMICDPVSPFFRPQLEMLLLFAEPGEKRAALDAWVSGFALSGQRSRRAIKVRLFVGQDPEGAEDLLRARVESIRRLDDRWKAASDPIRRLDSARFSVVPGGTLFERVVDHGSIAWKRPQQLLFRQGDVVVEILIGDPGAVDTDAHEVARRVRAALSGDPEDDTDRAAWVLRWKTAADRARDDSIDETDRAKGLLPLLTDPDARVRVRACRRIEDLDYGGDVIPWTSLRPMLSEEDTGIRAAAFRCLDQYRMPGAVRDAKVRPEQFPLSDLREGEGPPREVTAAILAGLEDQDGEVRLRAAGALHALGPLAPEVAEAYRRALTDEVSSVRLAALDSLRELKPPHPDLVDLVAPYLEAEEATKRVSAIQALSRSAKQHPNAPGWFLAPLDDDDPWVRRTAADALGELGDDSQLILGALMDRLEDENKEVRNACREALKELGVRPPKPKKK